MNNKEQKIFEYIESKKKLRIFKWHNQLDQDMLSEFYDKAEIIELVEPHMDIHCNIFYGTANNKKYNKLKVINLDNKEISSFIANSKEYCFEILPINKFKRIREIIFCGSFKNVSSIIFSSFFKKINVETINLSNCQYVFSSGIFRNCSKIVTVKLPNKSKIFIDEHEFLHSSIKNIICGPLTDLLYFSQHSLLEGYNNIRKMNLYVHDSIKLIIFTGEDLTNTTLFFMDKDKQNKYQVELSQYITPKMKNQEVIIVYYTNYEDLIDKIFKIISPINLNSNYILIGPKLTFSEKVSFNTKMKLYLKKLTWINVDEKTNKSETTEKDTFDKEIQKILEQIDSITMNLPESTRKIINSKINLLIENYENNQKNKQSSIEEVKFEINTIPNLSLNDKLDDKSILMIELESIFNNLSSQKEYAELAKSINKYKELLKDEFKETEDNDPESTIIKKLIDIASKMPDKIKDKILSKLNVILDNPLQEYNRVVSNEFDNKNNLTLNHVLMPIAKFKQQLNNYYEEIDKFNQNSIPYINIFNYLQNKTIFDETNLISTFKSIDEVLEKINDDSLFNEFNNLKNKYIAIIIDILDKEDFSNFDKLIYDINTDLKPFLEKLNIKASSYEKNKQIDLEKESLINELNSCLNIINNFVSVEDKATSITESYMIDILNEILNSNISSKYQEYLKKEILNFINSKIINIASLNIKDIKDFKEKLISDFATTYVTISIYINRVVREEKNLKKSILVVNTLRRYKNNN